MACHECELKDREIEELKADIEALEEKLKQKVIKAEQLRTKLQWTRATKNKYLSRLAAASCLQFNALHVKK